MPKVVFNMEELAVLADVPDRPSKLYMQGLRPYMDFATGIVGDRRRVSYQGFRELLSVDGSCTANNQPVEVSKKQARVAIDQLVRFGLVERLPTKNQRDPMRFRLPLAETGPVRPQESGHSQGTSVRAHPSSDTPTVSGEVRAQSGHISEGTPPVSGSGVVDTGSISDTEYPARERKPRGVPRGASAHVEGFQRWLATYPPTNHTEPDDEVFRAWRQAVSQDTCAVVLAGTERFAEHCVRERVDPQHVKSPVRFLRSRTYTQERFGVTGRAPSRAEVARDRTTENLKAWLKA